MTNKIQSGEFISVINSVWGLTQQLFNIFNILPQLYSDGLFATTLDEFFNYNSILEDNGTQYITHGIHNIEFRNVQFAYKGKENILSNINFIAKKGDSFAIVGQNGAGKSTLMKIMLRLYEPHFGNVMINGINYNNYRLSCLHKEIATAFQECNMYSYSIAENVLMRKCENDADEQRVETVLYKVGLLAKIKMHPQGVHANIYNRFDKDGIQLSGGELQKLSIARALAKDSSLIILDEPTASLDAISEKDLLQLIKKECSDKILILISHKLSLVKDFSQILVLNKGQIVEQGTHAELIAAQGLYRQLWKIQADEYGV